MSTDEIITGSWVECRANAAPTTPRAKHQYPSLVVRFIVSRDDCGHEGTGTPTQSVTERIINAPVILNRAEALLAEKDAEIARLRAQLDGGDL